MYDGIPHQVKQRAGDRGITAAEVTNRFMALEAAQNEVTPKDLWKGTKTVLLEVARETIGSVKSQKKKKWISDATYAAITEKREAKGKDKKRYQDLKAEVQRKLELWTALDDLCDKLQWWSVGARRYYRLS